MPKHDVTEAALEDLYRGPLETFVVRRKDLARALKNEGASEAAKELQRAKKPTVIAHALNRLTQEHEHDVQRLFTTSEALREAHAAALNRAPGAPLRDAQRAHKQALEHLVALGQEELARAGQAATTTTERKLRDALHTASFGPEETRTALLAGTLEREPERASGLGALGALPVEARPITEPRQTRRQVRRAAEEKRAEEKRAEEKRAEEKRAEEKRRERARSWSELGRELAAAEDEAEQLERLALDARTAAEQARSRVEGLRARLDEERRRDGAAEERRVRARRPSGDDDGRSPRP